MSSLLQVLLSLVGTALVLALAAQSLQEILKVMFALKGKARMDAIAGLIRESGKATGLSRAETDKIFEQIVERLRGLAQDGVRKDKVRLDWITPEKLRSLIQTATNDPTVASKLKQLSDRAIEWFDLSMAPVEERYRRRMRGWGVLTSAIVVLGLNADALTILQQARMDPAFRARVDSATSVAQGLRKQAQAVADSFKVAGSDSLKQALGHRSDSLNLAVLNVARSTIGSGAFLGSPANWRLRDFRWWIGIVASVLLVSLGAPFWHDLLETLFGLKNRMQAQAQQAASAVIRDS
jgi:hypothetical protein